MLQPWFSLVSQMYFLRFSHLVALSCLQGDYFNVGIFFHILLTPKLSFVFFFLFPWSDEGYTLTSMSRSSFSFLLHTVFTPLLFQTLFLLLCSMVDGTCAMQLPLPSGPKHSGDCFCLFVCLFGGVDFGFVFSSMTMFKDL